MDIDPELAEDTEQVRRGFGLEIIANDYIVTENGARHLLEVNHIPNVTRFPEMWKSYCDFVVDWINTQAG
jgi:D-alanine-D-alanine ligase-like ATP-grasp enzyme